MYKLRLLSLLFVCFLPQFLKKIVYRFFYGYKIGKNVKIGFSILDAKSLTIADNVKVGHLNLFIQINEISIGEHTRIGHINIIRGGKLVVIGSYVEIIRLNEINAMPNPVAANEVDSTLLIGSGSVIVASHKIDFTDKVVFGKRVILGGRNSSLWTHNRQHTKPIIIGDNCYLGSEIRITPGGEVAANCIVGIASVITKKFTEQFSLIAGVPAKVIKPLAEEDMSLLNHNSRADMPDNI
jgi:acetyltransferase-like isoleucine patch superfamily enzyme